MASMKQHGGEKRTNISSAAGDEYVHCFITAIGKCKIWR
jgi:hypothetical protein